MQEEPLIPGLFKKEFSKIAAVLTRSFGIEHLSAAEDIASDTFVAALETWTYKGVPQNPTAWLYAVARNKARNYLQREQTFTGKIKGDIQHSTSTIGEIEADWSTAHIADSQLQMLFAICHPVISVEAQIGLSLRILCGFGIEEIANAFLSNKETINKRLFRAKEKLREAKVVFEMPSPTEINERLNTVLTTLYLLFNEGYYSESREEIIREDLCLEAMTLTHMLLQDERTNLPPVHALLALMCFHTSRFPARKNANATLVLYEDQDESLWNKELISRGVYHLHQAATGDQLTRYHLEASIAYWHTIKEDIPEKWENILQLYNKLLRIEYSPIAALNRTYALAKANGNLEAIREAEKLQLTNNQYYFTLLGELYRDVDNSKSIDCFKKAFALARTQADKNAIIKRVPELVEGK
jgi:RNA polymerase sigma factor (sigma-70 family)